LALIIAYISYSIYKSSFGPPRISSGSYPPPYSAFNFRSSLSSSESLVEII
jgi:hypothetical protein